MTVEASDVELDDVNPAEWTIRDEEARQYVEEATSAVASLVRSTLGPRGMEKQIRTHDPHGKPETVQTGDANEILAAVERGDGFNHPVAALFVDCVDSMERGLGDGTTTATVLASALLERGVALVDEGLHPGNVAVGYAMASARSGTVLDTLASEVSPRDRETLTRIAGTAMTADIDDETRDEYANQVADAVVRLVDSRDANRVHTDDVKVVASTRVERNRHDGLIVRQRPSAVEESDATRSEFDREPNVPSPIEDATVAILDSEIDFEASATNFGSNVSAGSPQQLQAYRAGHDDRVAEEADRLDRLGVDVLVSQSEVEDRVRAVFERSGVSVIDRVQYPKSDVHRLARATGAQVVSALDDLSRDRMGSAGVVSQRRVGDERWTVFDGCGGGVTTLVLNADTRTGTTKAERVVEDALDVTATAAVDEQVLPGGGAPAMAVAGALRDYAPTISGREQLAVEAFADALEDLVYVLAENAGSDPIEALSALRAAHGSTDGPTPVGLDTAGERADVREIGILEPRRVFSQAIETANAAVEQLLTIDAVLHPNVDLGAYAPRTKHD